MTYLKKIAFLVLFALWLHAAQAQTAGVAFNDSTWSELLQMAQEENKIIFMDAYTDWCGPCKKMSKEVFTDAEVAAYYNDHFINVKMNMEKGEGPGIAQKYQVMAYPTLLFFDGGGRVVHRAVGYHNTDTFMELGNAANDPAKRLAGMDDRYAFGDRSADFLYDYTFARAGAGDGSHVEIAEEYLKTQDDLDSERNLTFLFRFTDDTQSELFDHFVKRKDKFVGLFGETPVARKIQYLIGTSVRDGEDGTALEQTERLYRKIYPERADYLTSEYAMMYYLRAGDINAYTVAVEKHYDTYGTDDWESLNETAWNYFEFVEDKKDLKRAVKWAKKSVALDENYYNTDTLAALYFKMGKNKKALKTARHAITLAKASGESYDTTLEMIEYIDNL